MRALAKRFQAYRKQSAERDKQVDANAFRRRWSPANLLKRYHAYLKETGERDGYPYPQFVNDHAVPWGLAAGVLGFVLVVVLRSAGSERAAQAFELIAFVMFLLGMLYPLTTVTFYAVRASVRRRRNSQR